MDQLFLFYFGFFLIKGLFGGNMLIRSLAKNLTDSPLMSLH